MSLNHHGFPVRDWTLTDIPVEDCSCGAPVYVLPEYGGQMGQVKLDAMPLRTFQLAGHDEPHAMLEHGEPRFSEHVCARHTFATSWLKRGLSSEELAIVMGHANPSTTSNTYIHVKSEDVKPSV